MVKASAEGFRFDMAEMNELLAVVNLAGAYVEHCQQAEGCQRPWSEADRAFWQEREDQVTAFRVLITEAIADATKDKL